MKCCSICETDIEPAWYRWVCDACGQHIHYRCIRGGVPIRDAEQKTCGCGGRLVAFDHEDVGQGSLFR